LTTGGGNIWKRSWSLFLFSCFSSKLRVINVPANVCIEKRKGTCDLNSQMGRMNAVNVAVSL
jgi:hypothetical protein